MYIDTLIGIIKPALINEGDRLARREALGLPINFKPYLHSISLYNKAITTTDLITKKQLLIKSGEFLNLSLPLSEL